jgi:hypothetical protein
MSIPVELQEGSLQNLMLCMNTAIALMQQLDKEKSISDYLFRKMQIQTLNNLTVCIGSIGQCIIKDMSTNSIIIPN